MRINVWIEHERHIPDFAKLTGIEEAILRARWKAAKESDRLCIFTLEMSEEQIEATKQWNRRSRGY